MRQEHLPPDLGLSRKKLLHVGVDFGFTGRAAMALVDYSDIEARVLSRMSWEPTHAPWRLKPTTTGRVLNTWPNGCRTYPAARDVGKSWHLYMVLFTDKLEPKGPLDDLAQAVQWGLRTGEIQP